MKNYPDYPVRKISNFLELLCNSVQSYSLHTAFRKTNAKITYQQLERAVLGVASSLLQYRNQYFLIEAETPFLFTVGYFATVLTGNIAVLINRKHCPETGAIPPIKLVLTDVEINRRMPELLVSYDELPHPDVNKVCTIVYSSGTSSASNGIMLSQKNICCNVVSGLEKYRFSDKDRLLQLIPYYHAFGLVCDLLAPLLSGVTICVPDSREQFFSQMAFFQPTILNVPPAVAEALLLLLKNTENAKAVTGGQLSKILCGGAELRGELTEEFLCWNIKALGCYGASECSPCISVNRDEYYKAGSAGIPLNCNVVRIAEDGEILVSGDNVMLGYYNDIERTNQVIVNGEYHSGDLGYMDEDGFLYVTGRKSNLIVFEDGTKCLPEILEKRILEHTAVREVVVFAKKINGRMRLCSQVYVSEPKMQEEVKKYILSIPTYQSFFSIKFVQNPFPKTITGKVRRNF